MDANLDPTKTTEDKGQLIDRLPPTWFEAEITFQQICRCFKSGKQEIRIACGFFTVKGWGKIRKYTDGKRVYLLVGIDEPGEERARAALGKEILRDLATGVDRNRRQTVQDLVQKMESGLLRVLDARAMNHHAKLYLVDRDIAIVSSANTTYRGFIEQIESGGLYGPPLIERFIEEHASDSDLAVSPVIIEALHRFIQVQVTHYIDKFDEYFAKAKDITQELLDAFKRWLNFVRPWDIYLKTMLALEDLQPIKHNYKKRPVSYQIDIIAQTLRQIREYGGSMLVASTGLGKTVVAVHVGLHLRDEDEIDSVLVIGPKAVRRMWERELLAASLPHKYFTRHALDQKSSAQNHSLEDFIEIAKHIQDQRWLLIIDESHEFRNRYVERVINRRPQQIERQAFKRLREIVQKGTTKVLLLTGSPYAKEIKNINNQLFLLPHTAQNRTLFEEPIYAERSWEVDSADDFINLPIASQLTTPHVAKYYGQRDGEDIYISFGQDRRYIPRIRLYSTNFHLPLESEITQAIINGYFNLNSRNPMFRKHIERLVRVAWASSPWAIRGTLERVIDTPGGLNEYDFFKAEFVFTRQERKQILTPIIEQLREKTFASDLKLRALLAILEELKSRKEKAIVFCERRATVVYLAKGLSELLPSLRVVGTIAEIESNNYQMKETKEIEKLIAQFAPIANEAEGKYDEDYDVFISTDAHGVGVNMQDASVVINYDIDWTPIGPIQRAGRILRFWQSPRTVDLYTFVPIVTDENPLKDELVSIRQRWENLMIRHDESKKLIDLPVLTVNRRQEISLPDMASRTIILGELNLEALADLEISPYYQHTAKLQLNRDYAKNIPSDIISAKTYPGQNPLIFVLVNFNGKYHWPVYDPKTQRLRKLDIVKLLDLIACSEDTETAMVEHDFVEELSDTCIQAWCEQESVNPEEVVRECALYLKPEGEGDAVKDWLNPPA